MSDREIELDEQRRLEALRLAVGNGPSEYKYVVETAQAYYKFLSGK